MSSLPAPPPRPDLGGRFPPPGAGWQHLHPAAIAVWMSGMVLNLVIGVVLFSVVGARGEPLSIFGVIAGLTAIGTVIRWLRLSYRIDGDTLVIRGGLIQRWQRTIQRSRVQSVDVVQKLTHRVFDVIELRIEVAGGRTTEGALVALRPEEADLLRGFLLTERPTEDDRAGAELVRMRPVDLLLAGITGGRVAVGAALAAYALQLVPPEDLVRYLDRLAGADRSGVQTVAVIAAALIVASTLISLITTVVVYWGFTAEHHGDRLVITRGLLQTRRSVVPLGRIQSIRMEENLIRRPFGLASLRVVTAGYGRDAGDQQQTSMLVPIAGRDRCATVASAILGWDELGTIGPKRATRSALSLRLARATCVGVLAVIIAWVFRPDVRSLVVAGVVAVSALVLAVLSWRSLGHVTSDGYTLARWGALLRRTAVARSTNVQHLQLRRSPFQRLFGLASVILAVPKGPVPMIDLEGRVAADRFDELMSRLHGAEAHPRPG